jgi:hypothetical protein
MRITLEWTRDIKCPIDINEYDQFTVQINDKDLHFQVAHSGPAMRFEKYMYPKEVWSIEGEQIQELKTKTKEQIAAEQSVAKAKEALIAAENALKAVKEKL